MPLQKKFMALGFVHPTNVVKYYEKLSFNFAIYFLTNVVDPFCNYIEITWVNVSTRCRHRNLTFQVKI